jgi:hypothetical protein
VTEKNRDKEVSIADLVAALNVPASETSPAPVVVSAPTFLLALDLGANVGWAAWQNGVVTSGVWHLQKSTQRRFEGPGMKFIRFVKLLEELPTPNLISYEEVRRHLGVDAAHAYGGYQSHLSAFCDGRTPKIPYQGIPVATIKKRATGSGNAAKEEMVTACEKLLGRKTEDDNEADALWILVLLCEMMKVPWPGGPVPEPPSKKKPKKASAK